MNRLRCGRYPDDIYKKTNHKTAAAFKQSPFLPLLQFFYGVGDKGYMIADTFEV